MINVDHFIVCTGLGEIFICDEAGEYQSTINNSPRNITQNEFMIEVIQATSKGFIVGGENAMIYVYNYNRIKA